MLLSDNQVSEVLKNDVIPVWEAIRPAAKVTIDFGNGKKLERTLKGNTTMFLCTPEGDVVDAYPGVYMPHDFLAEVKKGLDLIETGKTSPSELAAWHSEQVQISITKEVQRTTMSKAFVESPLLKAIGHRRRAFAPAEQAKEEEAPMDLRASFDLVTSRMYDLSNDPFTVTAATKAAGMKAQGASDEQIANMMLQEDSRVNVQLTRPAIHMLLGIQTARQTPGDLTDVVFKKLLQIPIDDPYLGLNDESMPGTPGKKGS